MLNHLAQIEHRDPVSELVQSQQEVIEIYAGVVADLQAEIADLRDLLGLETQAALLRNKLESGE